jgi:hypothetical protein
MQADSTDLTRPQSEAAHGPVRLSQPAKRPSASLDDDHTLAIDDEPAPQVGESPGAPRPRPPCCRSSTQPPTPSSAPRLRGSLPPEAESASLAAPTPGPLSERGFPAPGPSNPK